MQFCCALSLLGQDFNFLLGLVSALVIISYSFGVESDLRELWILVLPEHNLLPKSLRVLDKILRLRIRNSELRSRIREVY